jgi:hypothetical protein
MEMTWILWCEAQLYKMRDLRDVEQVWNALEYIRGA